jgi:hypothetical protein
LSDIEKFDDTSELEKMVSKQNIENNITDLSNYLVKAKQSEMQKDKESKGLILKFLRSIFKGR